MKQMIAVASVLFLVGFSPSATAAVGADAQYCAAGSSTPAFLVYFDGLKDRKGQLRLELYNNNDTDFLQDDTILIKAGKTFRRIEVNMPSSGEVAVCIKAPGPGTYALAVVHDRDFKRKFSFTIDGVGFPNNPKLGFSKPKAAKAAISVGNGVKTLRVSLNYFNGFGFSPLKRN